jgi:endo-1,4-beta-xylanase
MMIKAQYQLLTVALMAGSIVACNQSPLPEVTANVTPQALTAPAVPGYSSSDADLLNTADARIEYYRKGYIRVIVKDTSGRVIPNATVNIRQFKHGFEFGSALLELEPNDTSTEQTNYQNKFLEIFNFTTLPFFWNWVIEPNQGTRDYAKLDRWMKWTGDRSITNKASTLAWTISTPPWASYDVNTFENQLSNFMSDIITRYKDRVKYWVLMNEFQNRPANNPMTNWLNNRQYGIYGAGGFCLATAQRARGTTNTLFGYNDYLESELGDFTYNYLDVLKTGSYFPDFVGIQWHTQFAGTAKFPMTRAWNIAHKFQNFQKGVHFTEISVLSGPERANVDANGPDQTNWNTDATNEAKQADYTVKLYKTLFSHPAIQTLTWWNLTDKKAWLGAPTGLIRKDMSAKPAFTQLKNLIKSTWWTNITNQKTNSSGTFTSRAFLGIQRVNVSVNGKTGEAYQYVGSNGNGVTEVTVTVR